MGSLISTYSNDGCLYISQINLYIIIFIAFAVSSNKCS